MRGRPDEVREGPTTTCHWSQSGSLAPLVVFLALGEGRPSGGGYQPSRPSVTVPLSRTIGA
ncbi:MAG: hypothetical protein ACYCR4_07790 [Acidimicrobiales bacterium]